MLRQRPFIAQPTSTTYRNTTVVTRTTSNENDAPGTTNVGNVIAETAKSNSVIIKVDTAAHGVDNGFGLFKNLFQHEVRKLSLKWEEKNSINFANIRSEGTS